MIHRRTLQTRLLTTLLSAMVQVGCNKTPPANSAAANSSPAPASAQNSPIQIEIVTPQSIAGVIPASGKILIPEDCVAVIGPVNAGRIVRLYAGQGSRVRKGQKLADLESADIDQAEADFAAANGAAKDARAAAEKPKAIEQAKK